MIKKTAPKTHKAKKVGGRLPSVNPHFTLNVDVEVVAEMQDDMIVDAELFNTEAEALEHISGLVGKKFKTVDDFFNWEDDNLHRIGWFQKSIELGL